MEMDNRYANDLVDRLGMSSAKSVGTPGTKECGKGMKEKPLGKQAHREYRGGAGVGQYMAEHRVDSTYATKELMRDASQPTDVSMMKLKRLARYVKGRPEAVQDFPWASSCVDGPARNKKNGQKIPKMSPYKDSKTSRRNRAKSR